MYPSQSKTYIRKRPKINLTLSSDITTLIDSLSITIGINKSLLVERLIELVLARYSMDEIIDALAVKK